MKHGVLLRSGRADAFMALGEGGRPVFRSAVQLREALRRRAGNAADHLAIPQSNEIGTTLDWYSPFSGAVVSWAAATESERESARQQLSGVLKEVERLAGAGDSADQAGKEVAGDKSLFSSLLRRVMYFPDENFVYLVDGKAVLTFWGFLHHGADQGGDPLLCLAHVAPAAVVAEEHAAPLAPAVPGPVAASVGTAPVVGRGWAYFWSRYGWRFLALLLLLALLLFGLRWCTAPALPAGGLSLGSVLSGGPSWLPAWLKPSVPSVPIGTASVVGGGATLPLPDMSGAGLIPSPQMPLELGSSIAPPPVDQSPAPASSAMPPTLAELSQPGALPISAPPVDAPVSPPAPDTPAVSPGSAPQVPATAPSLPDSPAVDAAPASLVVPPNALQSGKLGFLNGQWAARMGVQDSQTGKPVQLQYQLADGAGQVQVRRGDGVQCEAPVTASALNGQLVLNTGAAAQCTDSTVYDMPKIVCDPGVAGAAARCAGMYGADAFPLTLQQAE
ncbi:SrfA family protein [Alcaligenes sp. SDU_A2]|uniref:SrfA family protein n=1 Tax=Alcaligenes sp. SDU_A2 TaxID=3136634 RepID=UPI0031204D86